MLVKKQMLVKKNTLNGTARVTTPQIFQNLISFLWDSGLLIYFQKRKYLFQGPFLWSELIETGQFKPFGFETCASKVYKFSSHLPVLF